MSDEEQTMGDSSDGEYLTAEFKDGKLEIVEVASYSQGGKHIDLPEGSSDGNLKFMQIVEPKNTVVDLLNFALVRGEDGEETYQLVGEGVEGGEEGAAVTCVLADDGGDHEGQQYVMVDGSQGPLVFLQSTLQPAAPPAPVSPAPHKRTEPKNQPITPAEILERAKALQKAKALLSQTKSRPQRGPRATKRKSELPPPHELLASPNFKLFLYSCKLCRFKCNAVKELTAHKAAEHGGGGGRSRGAGRAAAGTLQCARCPFRAATHSQLMKHVQVNHVETIPLPKVFLDSAEVEAADVLVCGACGFESGSRELFKRHIEQEHGATTG